MPGYVSSQCSRCCLRIQSWLRNKRSSQVQQCSWSRHWALPHMKPWKCAASIFATCRLNYLRKEILTKPWITGLVLTEGEIIRRESPNIPCFGLFPSTNAGVQARLIFSNDDSDPATRDNTSSAVFIHANEWQNNPRRTVGVQQHVVRLSNALEECARCSRMTPLTALTFSWRVLRPFLHRAQWRCRLKLPTYIPALKRKKEHLNDMVIWKAWHCDQVS